MVLAVALLAAGLVTAALRFGEDITELLRAGRRNRPSADLSGCQA